MSVSTSKIKELELRMKKLGVHDKDISEHFVRSSGSGGQNVNKVSSCVVLKHIPSGIEVKCQQERSQALNRFLARRILVEKLEKLIFKKESAAEKKRWKIRKQKQKRLKRVKEKILADKRRQSEKKRLRSFVRDEN